MGVRGAAFVLVLAAALAPLPSQGNRFQEAWVKACDHTFEDGSTFDLRPLTRTAGRPDYVGKDKRGDMFYMNVCSNVQEIPRECRALQKAVRSPVYQVRNDSYCHWLGTENSVRWDLIEPGSPYVGVMMTYENGEMCSEGYKRRVKMQFYCDKMGKLGSVQDYYVTRDEKEPCTYVVTFPTEVGCPKESQLSGGWIFVLCFFGFVGVYFGVGLMVNVHQKHMPVSIEALPHIDMWRQVPDLVKDGVAFSIDTVLVALRLRENHRGGGSFEWSGL